MSRVIEIFRDISRVKRCSFQTKKFREYLINYAERFNFDYQIDLAGNILIKRGEKSNLALQAHYDMVCVGDEVDIIEERGFLKSKNSSLGADNGVAIAMMLALIEREVEIEYLFTNDEEVGLIGAKELELELNSSRVLNLDSEDEQNIFIGCAGGFDLFVEFDIEFEKLKEGYTLYSLKSFGFEGGHSGVDIDRGIPNAIEGVIEFLRDRDIKVIDIKAGEKINSIPVNVELIFASKDELESVDNFKIDRLKEGDFSLAISNSKELLEFLSQFKSGVLKRDREFDTPSVSMNFAMLTRGDGKILSSLSFRANRDEDLEELANQMQDKLKGFKFTIKDRYPAWTPEVSPFAKEIQAIYRDFGFLGDFKIIHAGLESAIIKSKFKNMQICSIGPNILYPHSKKEQVEIASIDRVYRVLERVVELNS